MSASGAIRALVEELGFEYREGTFWTACPECPRRIGKDDGKRKLTIRTAGQAKVRPRGGGQPAPFECSPENAVFNCFRCHFRGIGDFSWLVGMAPADVHAVAKEEPEEMPPRGFVRIAHDDQAYWAAHWALQRRVEAGKADRNVVQEARAAGVGIVRGLGSLRKYRNRLVIPAHAADGSWLGFVAWDAVGDGVLPPYLTPRRMPREKIVMGVEDAPLRGPGPVYLVEGSFDRLALFPYAWAFLGKEWQAGQLEIVAAQAQREGREVIPCLDGDAPLENRALESLLRGMGVACPGRIELPVGTDPGKLGWGVLPFFVPRGQ